MDKHVEVAIIGAGTAGLSAFKEVKKYTDKVLIMDSGPLGSTCARVGCMPSKALIQVANSFHDRHGFSKQGIHGAQHLSVHLDEVMSYVRALRDHFTQGVIETTTSLGEHFLREEARFSSDNTLLAGKYTIHANATIIATGSRSIVPREWLGFKHKILTSETLFEQDTLRERMAIIGGGSIGLELGQALSRLGVQVSLYHGQPFIGGITDPLVNERAIALFQDEFSLYLNQKASITEKNDALFIEGAKESYVDQAIAAMGRKPNVDSLDLPKLSVPIQDNGLPAFDETTMRVAGSPIYVAGDVNQFRPILHEAADEGRIAGFNAVHKTHCFKRRTPLYILFTEPNIALVGQQFQTLTSHMDEVVIGEVDFSHQGRATLMQKNQGLLRVYGTKREGRLLGAELIAPQGEHLAHLLAWAIEQRLTAFDVLQMPFYHPVLEEGMRTALRDLGKQVSPQSSSFDLTLCDSEAIPGLS